MIQHYLMFNGSCQKALEIYQKAFNATVSEVQTYGDMPPNPAFPISEAQKDLVLHARLQILGCEIMAADSEQAAPGSNMYISIMNKDADLIQNAFSLLSAGGKVYMALAPSFFAALHGSLQDQFGINWMFTVEK